MYDAINSVLSDCKDECDLERKLNLLGINTEYKLSLTTDEIQGISFRYGNVSFKGSQIDRKFSYGNLKKVFEKNMEYMEKQRTGQIKQLTVQVQDQTQPKEILMPIPNTPKENKLKTPSIGGVQLSAEQWNTLKEGGVIYLENINKKDNTGHFSAFVFLNEEKNRAFFSNRHPDDFVKYGNYEMCVRDKMLIEAGYITKAKVKWYGGNFAYPYLWKENKSDSDYKESFVDPRKVNNLLSKEQDESRKHNPQSIGKNRGGKP